MQPRSHISNNKEHQNEIYRSLTKNDIVKIISNLEDSNGGNFRGYAVLRRMSARLLCELLYDNDDLKELFVQTMNIVPSHGNVTPSLSQIVLNKFPEVLLSRPEHIVGSAVANPEIMRYLKTARLPPSNEKEICWFVDVERPDHNLQLVTHSSFQIHEFLDPARVLIGITYTRKDTSRNRVGYPEFGVNQTHTGITKSGIRGAHV